MKLRRYVTMLAAAMTLCACSTDDDPTETDNTVAVPVSFGTYLTGTTTRSTANLNNITDVTDLQAAGFGVFAYYTGQAAYPESVTITTTETGGTTSTGYEPNFMYNQKVEYKDGSWTYTPLKYWPNEAGDKVSFFAYAPYRTSDEAAFTIVTDNNEADDPKLFYIMPTDPQKNIDLLYAGVKDVTKQKIGETVNFAFHHALARLGLTVQGVFDEVTPDKGTIDTDTTKITIESIKLSFSNMKDRGVLNLNGGTWTEEATANGKWTVTIDKNNGLSAALADDGSTTAAAMTEKGITGATQTEANVSDSYLTLIPQKQDNISVTIVYYTTTDDASLVLTGGYRRIRNEVTNPVTIDFSQGQAYTLKMLLGMTKVKFQVTAEEWKEPITFNPTVDDWGSEGFDKDFAKEKTTE